MAQGKKAHIFWTIPIKGNPGSAPSVRVHVLARASLLALTATTLLAGPGYAQTASAPAEGSAPPVESVVVTGSLIARAGYSAPTPVTSVSTADLQAAAPVNVADYVNELPALSGSATATSGVKGISSGSAGANILNLRNLGASRTLVLFDGQRSVTSSLAGTTDINDFPQALISRVDVVTGGASAAYGSDAVAGVVNFILDKDYTGLKGEFSKGQTTYGDDKDYTGSLTYGTSLFGGRGHFLLSAEMAHTDGFTSTKPGFNNHPRAWAMQGWKIINNPAYTATNGQPRQLVVNNVGISEATYGGLIVSGPLKGVAFGVGGVPYNFNYGTVSGNFMRGGDWQSTDMEGNTSLDAYLTRQSVFGRLSYDISDNLNVFAQWSYTYSQARSQDTFESQFGGLFINPATNPFVPASVKAQAAALGLSQIEVGTLNGDLPPFGAINSTSVYRYVGGASGKFDVFGSTWNWDAYFQDGESHVHNTAHATSKSRYLQAIQAVEGPNGQAVCADPSNNCVPYNLFGVGVNSQAAINYVEGHPYMDSVYIQDVASIKFQGEPFSNWAGPVSIAFGASHRREHVSGTTDAEDLALDFYAGNYVPTFGSYNVDEGFIEAIVPLVENVPLVQDLSLDAAWRSTNYSVSGFVNTWKTSLSWTPIDDLRVRATLSRDIRAPNLGELFQKGTTSTTSYIDPFAGGATYTAFTLSTGNPNLKPEKAQSTDIGVVWQPSNFLPGLSASVDYFRIAIGQAIGTAVTGSGKGQNLIDQCYAGQTQYCSAIIRGGPLVNGVSKILFVQQLEFNQASQKEDGIDYNVSYATPMDSIIGGIPGNLSLHGLATNTFQDTTFTGNPGDLPNDAAGTNAGNGPAHWRFLASIGYSWDPIDLTLTGRGLSAGKYSNLWIACTSACPTSTAQNITQNTNKIDGAFYLDLNIAYNFTVRGTDDQVYFNVKNLFNSDPPLVAAGPSGTTFTTAGENAVLYDVLGRVFQAGVRFNM